MAGFAPTPLDFLQKMEKRDDMKAQFSEDIRDCFKGGYGKGSSSQGDGVGTRTTRSRGVRNHSPGLAAAASLAMGSTARANSEDPRSIARQNKEKARGQGCPFDDHNAFRSETGGGVYDPIVGGPNAEEPRGHMGTARSGGGARSLTPSRSHEAFALARNAGKQNRDQQNKIFSAAPWDAPERAWAPSSYAAASEGIVAAAAGTAPGQTLANGKTLLPTGRTVPVGAPEQSHNYTDAKREAASNRTRMAGQNGIIAGSYLLTEGKTAVPVGRSGKPPPAGGLLPQAMLKAQMDGLGAPSQDRAAFLNAQVMSEACRARNNNSLLHFC